MPLPSKSVSYFVLRRFFWFSAHPRPRSRRSCCLPQKPVGAPVPDPASWSEQVLVEDGSSGIDAGWLRTLSAKLPRRERGCRSLPRGAIVAPGGGTPSSAPASASAAGDIVGAGELHCFNAGCLFFGSWLCWSCFCCSSPAAAGSFGYG